MPRRIIPINQLIARTCAFCGTAFAASRCVVNRGGGKFCSRSCLSKHTRSRQIDPPLSDLTGKRFARLIVTGRTKRRNFWACLCDCGKTAEVWRYSLLNGDTKSCGCLHDELCGQRRRKHGMSGHSEFTIWGNMKQRCLNPNDKFFHRYGGRDITVCDRWLHSFENFHADMGPRPTPYHSIDRINNNGNYEPGNCRWATPKQQAENKAGRIFLTIRNETKSIPEWSQQLGISISTIYSRHNKGETDEACLEHHRRHM